MAETSLTSDHVEVAGAFEAMELYFERGWTDGLPVVPPTAEAVERFLDAAGLVPERVLGVEPTKSAVITAEKAAVNAVMAGCRPEYMPVIAAAVEAMSEDRFSLHAITVSTMGAAILVIVGGPVSRELGVNSGTSVFGPGHRANATIGRAIRLIVMNVLGTRPGVLDKGTLGHAGRYTWCIAEDEELSPWQPLHADRGLPADASAVTVFAGLAAAQVGEGVASEPEGILDAFKDSLFAMGPQMQELLVVLCPEHIEHIRRAGWSKQQIGEYLYETARRSAGEWAAAGRPAAGADDDRPVSALASPDAALTIVAGGAGGAWSMAIPSWSLGARSKAVTKPVSSV